MTVANFMKQYGSMSKDGTTDGSAMYHNDQIIIVSDPKMIDDLKINSITVTGAKYTLNGIYAGMNADEAASSLASQGWKIKTSESSLVVYSRNSDLMKLTVRNGSVAQVELCLAVSIATNIPSETTTEPDTQETTTAPEESTSDSNKMTVDDLPFQIRSFLSGNFGFSGTIINSEGKPSDVTLYTNGNDICIDLVMELNDGKPVNVRVLIEDSQSKPTMFMINTEKKQYAHFNPALFGGSIDDFKVGMNVGDMSAADISCSTQTVDNTEYEVYSIKTPSGITHFYTVNEEIKRVSSFNNKGAQMSSIDMREFYTTFPDGVFTLSQYKKVLSFLTLFTDDGLPF